MAVALHILEAMRDAGCSLDQVLAVLRADLAERARRRERRAEIGALCLTAIERELFPGAASESAFLTPESAFPAPAAAPRAPESAFPAQRPETDAPRREAPATGADRADPRKAIARKALLMGADFGPAERAVGAMLVDRCNLGTGRLDVTAGRLALDTGLTVRSVRRALAALQERGLLARAAAGGGRGRGTGWALAWAAFSPIAAEAETRTPKGNTDSLVRKPGPQSQPKPSYGNQIPSQRLGHQRAVAAGEARSGARAGPSRRPDPRQPEFMLPIPGGKAKGEAAYGAAGERLWQDFRRHCAAQPEGERMAFLDGFARLGQVTQDRLTLAEQTRPGSGLALLLEAIGPPGTTADDGEWLGKRAGE